MCVGTSVKDVRACTLFLERERGCRRPVDGAAAQALPPPAEAFGLFQNRNPANTAAHTATSVAPALSLVTSWSVGRRGASCRAPRSLRVADRRAAPKSASRDRLP